MGNRSSSVRTTTPHADEKSHKEAGAAGAPSSVSCSSFEKTVLLNDWWLVKVEDEHSCARLGVGGLAATGKAVRIFKSAPIIKRYDGYTIETADGITVRIQGLINTSRMHHNGFPSEACSHFRIGFPYAWREYADRYFRTESEGKTHLACTSVHHDAAAYSADTIGNNLPACLTEFSVGKVVDSLNSICHEIVDGTQRTGSMEIFENTHNSKNTKETDCSTDGASNDANGSLELASWPCDDSLRINPFVDKLEKSNNHYIGNSSFCQSMILSRPLEKVTGFNMDPLMKATTCLSIRTQELVPSSINFDNVVNGNMSKKNVILASNFEAKFLLGELISGNEKSKYAEQERDPLIKKMKQAFCLPEVTSMIHSHTILEKPTSSSVDYFLKDSMNFLMEQHANSSSHLVPRECVDISCNQGKSSCSNNLDEVDIDLTSMPMPKECSFNETNCLPLEVSGAPEDDVHVVNSFLPGGDSDGRIVRSHSPKMMPLKEATNKKAYLESDTECASAKPSCLSNTASKKTSSSVTEKNVHQLLEDEDQSLVDPGMMNIGSERVLMECSYNKEKDLQPDGSRIFADCAARSVKNSINICTSVEKTNTECSYNKEKDLQPDSSGLFADCAARSVMNPSNICARVETANIDPPSMRMAMSEPASRCFSLRRSERLLKLKSNVEIQRFYENNEQNRKKNGSQTVSYAAQNKKNMLTRKNRSTMREESHQRNDDVHAIVARKLNFFSHESLDDHDNTASIEASHVGLERNTISSADQEANSVQVHSVEQGLCHDFQKNSRSGNEVSEQVADAGMNQVLSAADVCGFINADNGFRDLRSVSDRAGVSYQNLDMHVVQQKNMDQDFDKYLGRTTKKSKKRPNLSQQTAKVPWTRQRVKTLSFESSELLNFRRSRSGRLIIPPISNWCQQILYELDGSVSGIVTGVDAISCYPRGSRSEPPRKRRRRRSSNFVC